MKIGIDIRPMLGQRAGIGYYVHWLVLSLAKIDHKNEYYLFSDKPFPLHINNPNFIRVVVPSPFWHLKVALEVIRRKIDLYHSTHSFIVPALIGSKSVLTFHDASAFRFSDTPTLKVKFLTKLFMRWALNRSGMIIVPSQSTKEDVLEFSSAKEKKIRVIPEAVDDYFSASKERDIVVKTKYQLPEKFILFNATIEPRKNIARLLEAYGFLREKYGLEIPLILAGKKGWGVREEDLNKQGVKWLGWVPDNALPSLYRLSTLFVYPSVFEGFGLSVLKAFKMGVPVLTSNVSSLPEVADHAALLVDPFKSDEIAEGMRKILGDQDYAERLVKSGREWLRNFSWDTTARKTLEVYQNFYETS